MTDALRDLLRRPDFGALVRAAPDAPPLKNELALDGMRIGLFGGSFNPVHEGHAHVAREAMRRLGLHRVWWLVSPQNPLKPSHETQAHARRLADVAAMARAPGHVVSDVERRLGTSFTSATLGAILKRHPRVRFVWIMGADNLAGFHRWRGWTEIMRRVPVAVIARPGDERTGDEKAGEAGENAAIAPLRARLGRLAQRYRSARIRDVNAPALVETPPPAWVYLTTRWHSASSTELRARATRALPRR